MHNLSVSETFSIQPELQYSSITDEGESTGLIIIPLMMKFHVTENFNLMAGPQFDYITERIQRVLINLVWVLG